MVRRRFQPIDWDILSPKPCGNAPGLSKILLEISNDYGLEQSVRGPTSINNTLDLFFTTNHTLVERSTIVPGISDHDGIPIIITSCKHRVIKQNPCKIYMYPKANTQALKEACSNGAQMLQPSVTLVDTYSHQRALTYTTGWAQYALGQRPVNT